MIDALQQLAIALHRELFGFDPDHGIDVDAENLETILKALRQAKQLGARAFLEERKRKP